MYNVQRGTTSNFNCIIMCSLQFIIFSFPCCWLFSSSSTSAFCFSRRCSPVIYVFTSQLFPLPHTSFAMPLFCWPACLVFFLQLLCGKNGNIKCEKRCSRTKMKLNAAQILRVLFAHLQVSAFSAIFIIVC